MDRYRLLREWQPPEAWHRIRVIDAHTGGEPLRIVADGFPEVKGDTMLARRQYLREHLDHFRRALMWEPRGHADMYGCLIVPAVSPEAAFGVLFMHNEGYSTMCGHGIIAVLRVAIETGLIPREEPVTTTNIDTPAGLIRASARVKSGVIQSITFENVPSFVLLHDEHVDVPGLGRVRFDVAFGGAFYAFVRAADCGLRGDAREFRRLIEYGMRIKHAVMGAFPITHPLEQDLGYLYGTIFISDPFTPGMHSRHVCVFAEGEVDRSPTGTGVSARLALEHLAGRLRPGESIGIESIVGSVFQGRIRETTACGAYPAVIPEIEGMAHLCGTAEFLVDPDDPFRFGFMLR